jgi:hypothetical protein
MCHNSAAGLVEHSLQDCAIGASMGQPSSSGQASWRDAHLISAPSEANAATAAFCAGCNGTWVSYRVLSWVVLGLSGDVLEKLMV